MVGRRAHLVGSLPGDTPEQAMRTALEVLGPRLRSLPDGETGERRNWVISIVDSLRDHPDLELVKAGDWSDYDKTPTLRVRRGRTLYGANLDFGHVTAVRDTFPVFERLRAEFDVPDLVFQSGVPGDLDLAMFTLGPVGALRHRTPFTEATLTEIRGVREIAGPDTVFQIELPVELVLLAKAPRPAQPVLAGRLAAGIARLAGAAPAGSVFGLHLCLGDMNNKAFGTMTDVAPLVSLSNAIVAQWPTGQRLAYVHAPFAAADQPATTDAAFYAPLDGMRLPDGTSFVAGFAHEAQSLDDQLTVRTLIEDRLGHAADVAAACGFGRRTPADGRAVLERTAELLD
jgi:hypothetical protein